MQVSSLRKINSIFLLGFASIASLYYAATFFIPLTVAIFLAMLLAPMTNKLELKGIGKVWAPAISTLVVFILVSALTYLFVVQMQGFIKDLPGLQGSVDAISEKARTFLSKQTSISQQQQQQYLDKYYARITINIENKLTAFVGMLLNTTIYFVIVLVYTYLLLLKRHKYKEFVLMLFPSKDKEKVEDITEKTTNVAFQYLWGRLKVMLIIGTMHYLAFRAFDLKHVIVLTIFVSIVAVIPYIGSIVSSSIPFLLYILNEHNLLLILSFGAVLILIQLIESYLVEPIIIGSEMHLSALTILLCIMAGDLIWGIAGMLLFIPMVAIVKILFDHVENLNPFAFLLGDTRSPVKAITFNSIVAFFKKRKK